MNYKQEMLKDLAHDLDKLHERISVMQSNETDPRLIDLLVSQVEYKWRDRLVCEQLADINAAAFGVRIAVDDELHDREVTENISRNIHKLTVIANNPPLPECSASTMSRDRAQMIRISSVKAQITICDWYQSLRAELSTAFDDIEQGQRPSLCLRLTDQIEMERSRVAIRDQFLKLMEHGCYGIDRSDDD